MSILKKFKSVFSADKAEPKAALQELSATRTPTVESGRSSELASLILEKPHISEKATDLSQKNKYVFRVTESANKIQIKQAIEGLYGVKVLRVNVLNVKGKRRALRRVPGFTPGYKKAIVEITQGQKIDVLPQ